MASPPRVALNRWIWISVCLWEKSQEGNGKYKLLSRFFVLLEMLTFVKMNACGGIADS